MQMPEQLDEPTSTQTSSDILGFADSLQFATMAINLYNNLTFLHKWGQNSEARELFKNTLADFQSLFDAEFIIKCMDIEKYIDENQSLTSIQKEEQIYRLQRGQFARLLVRMGVVRKPDIRIHMPKLWKAPEGIIGVKKDDGNSTT